MPTNPIAVKLRLSPTQTQVIDKGLDFIAKAWIVSQQGRTTGTFYPFAIKPLPAGVNAGTFNQAIMDRILALWKRLAPKARTGGRMQMDWLELRIAIFACRSGLDLARYPESRVKHSVFKRRKRRSKSDPEIARLAEKTRHVIACLEQHQKRATRLFKKTVDTSEFNIRAAEWKQHLHWIRLNLTFFRTADLLFGHSPLCKLRRRIVRRLVEIAQKVLPMQGYDLPPERTIRQAVRLYTRDCRRFRIPPRHLDLLTGAATYMDQVLLAEYIAEKLNLKKVRTPIVPGNLTKAPAAKPEAPRPPEGAKQESRQTTPSPVRKRTSKAANRRRFTPPPEPPPREPVPTTPPSNESALETFPQPFPLPTTPSPGKRTSKAANRRRFTPPPEPPPQEPVPTPSNESALETSSQPLSEKSTWASGPEARLAWLKAWAKTH